MSVIVTSRPNVPAKVGTQFINKKKVAPPDNLALTQKGLQKKGEKSE